MRDGKTSRFWRWGSTVLPSLLAAEALSTWGFETSVCAMRFLRPWMQPLFGGALQCQLVLTVESTVCRAVCSAEAIHQILEPGLVAKVRGLGLPAIPRDRRGAAPEQFQLDAEGSSAPAFSSSAFLNLPGASSPDAGDRPRPPANFFFPVSGQPSGCRTCGETTGLLRLI